MDCLFCKIAQHKSPSYTVIENDDSIAFLDIHPLSTGHTVVIPKQHADRIIDLPAPLVGRLFLTVKAVSDRIHASLKPDGLTIGINDGAGAQQGAGHLHVHIIPRWNGDGGSNVHAVVQNAPKESLAAILSKLKQ